MITNPPETTRLTAPDTARAVDFLTTLFQEGRVALGAIVPDGPIEGETFTLPGDRAGMFDWIDARQDKANLHFRLNEPVERSRQRGRNGCVRAEDIARLRGVSIDLDPNREEEMKPGGFERERARLRQQMDALNGGVFLSPTAIVDSGGGYQAFWLLTKPIDATPENVARIIAQARGLNKEYGGDATQSVEHLFRLPFTANLPDRRKRERGRVRTLATVVSLDAKERTNLEILSLLAAPIVAAPAATSVPAFDVSGAIAITGFPEELDPELQVRLADILNRTPSLGCYLNAERSPHSDDRSKRDFAAVKVFARQGIEDPFDLACLLCAFLPERIMQEEERGRGEWYVGRTVSRALDEYRAELGVTDRFDISAASLQGGETLSRRGIEAVTGRIDPQTLPTRKWLIHPRLPLAAVTLLVGEPAVSKSTFALRDALIVATGDEKILRGEDSLNPERLHRSGPVIVYNAEDDGTEMKKRLSVAQEFHGVATMRHSVLLWSGVDDEPLVLMRRETAGAPLVRALGADLLVKVIQQTGAVLVVLDPLISLFAGAEENSTEDMNAVMQQITNDAARLKVSIMVVQHTGKKTRDHAGDMGAGRGAFSVVAKARSQFTLVEVSSKDAEDWGVVGRDVLRLDLGKSSYGQKTKAPLLFERLSRPVGNGNMPSEGEQFTTAEEMLRLKGDTAPVLNFLKMGSTPSSGAAVKVEKQDTKHALIGHAVLDVMGDLQTIALGQTWQAIASRMVELNVSKATSRNAITDAIKIALGGKGLSVEKNGQVVRLQTQREGVGDTAPWIIRAICPPISDQTESLSAFTERHPREDLEG